MRHSEAIDMIAAALVKAQGDLPNVKKDATNPHFKSRYASLDAITDAAIPALNKHGIVLIQGGGESQDDTGVEVVTRLLHASGQWMESGIRLPYVKPDPQGAGSAITYGRRYGLAAMLGIVADEDDDGNAAVTPRNPARIAARSNGQPVAPAGAPTLPFGKSKGKALSVMDTESLQSALDWAKDKGRYEEFQADAIAELVKRQTPESFDDMPEALKDDGDDLPF